MKKLLLKIFLMMLLSMLLVFSVSGIARYFIIKSGVNDPDVLYYISLTAGLCGLLLFAVLLNFFVIRRLKRLSVGVNEVAKGNYQISLNDNGFDEIQRLVNDFNNMTKELKSNEYLSREFIRNVSHELKTPLSSIMGYAELLIKGANDIDKVEYSKIIYAQAKRLNEIGKQMLEISRLDSTSLIMCNDLFKVDEQIRSIILSLQNDWSKKSINFSVEMSDTEFLGNEEMTYHIWQNLISNAVKFVDLKGKISVSLIKNDKLNFKITNTGKGIPKDKQQNIFNQFYTLDKNEKMENGTGLGLSIVRKITEKLNGKVWFESEENVHTTFYVELCEKIII